MSEITPSAVADIIGWIACVCMIGGYMPQAIATIRSRNTEGISFLAWTLMALGSLCFVAMGILTLNWPLAATNVITGVCSLIVLSIKRSNERKKKLL